jgi:hypothetical protein
MNAYKFSDMALNKKPDILQGITPGQFLKEKYTKGFPFGLFEIKRSGHYKIHGWSFDFTPYLKRYVVKDYHGNIHEEWAPNKTAVRTTNYGRIEYIIEVK